MLDVVYGQTKKQTIAGQLIDELGRLNLNGTLYIGYPILALADEAITIDALLVCRECGLIGFEFASVCPRPDDESEWRKIKDQQDRLYVAIENSLARHESLRKGRGLGITIQIVTLCPERPQVPIDLEGGIATDIPGLKDIIRSFPPLPENFEKPLHAALQRVTTIKPIKKRTSAVTPQSRGDILKRIEREIANLDQWQKGAAIESPEGPQRIRGLAGSGKTVVLALKAAYLHAQNPDWAIAVTFHTRSLYQQFRDLIRRFSFEHLGDEPNWDNLRVIHAWGSSDRDGVYTEIAKSCGITPRDFLYGKAHYGRRDAFHGICSELLSATNDDVEPLYDAVLIDEAQDLPWPFFHLVYRFTREPKRIVWAYDELQNLSETTVPPLEDLFGKDDQGNPRIRLFNTEGQPRQDIILPVCYRNTPWALTLAHALGFGIYRKEGIVQHFDEPSLWTEIGYRVLQGNLNPGQRVSLERSPTSYPSYFKELLHSDDAVVSVVFKDEVEQAEWIAKSVQRNLQEDELEVDDILIILPNALIAQKRATAVRNALTRRGIDAHLAGVTTSRDEIFSRRSVALANIFRSKGNEAPMVYVLDCQYCVAGHELIRLRNILFTAVTRSRAWVRLCGWGDDMARLQEEIESIRNREFRLEFSVPTPEQLAELRRIHRERTADEIARIQQAEKGLRDFLQAVERGDLAMENLSLELRTALAKYASKAEAEDDDF